MDIDGWLARLSAELQIADVRLDDASVATLLDLARDAAHEVGERRVAPLTTFLVGVAVGRGAPLSRAAAEATTLLLGLDTEARSDSSDDADADPTN